jgi:hypothetical protein
MDVRFSQAAVGVLVEVVARLHGGVATRQVDAPGAVHRLVGGEGRAGNRRPRDRDRNGGQQEDAHVFDPKPL